MKRRGSHSKSFKKQLRENPVWLTLLCAGVSVILLAGLLWIAQDIYRYQYTIRTVTGAFESYEVVSERSFAPRVHITKQGNLYIDGERYVIASDSLQAFSDTSFVREIVPGDTITVWVTSDNVVYALEDAGGNSYLSLGESRKRSTDDNMIGILLIPCILIVVWVGWYAFDARKYGAERSARRKRGSSKGK